MKDISPKWLLFDCICTGLVMFNTLFWPWAVTAERGDGPVGENPTISPQECFFLIFYSLSCPLSPSLFAPLPIVKPSTLLLQEWCNFHARFFLVKSICINIDLVFSLHPLPSTTTCFCYLPFCWFTLPDSLSPTRPWRDIFWSAEGGLCYHLLSPPWCDAPSKRQSTEEWIPSET